MATVTTCPRCSEKLRLPDELRGQRVRCPQCSNIFEATDSSSAPPPPAPASPPPGLDVPLNLSLDNPQPVPPPSRSQPVGAMEINLSLDDDAPKPTPSTPPSSPPPSRSDRKEREPERDRDRDRDRDREGGRGDMIRCPVCRRSNHRDTRRCYHCGERLLDGPRDRDRDRDRYEDDPYRRRRRDTEPHRGGLVLAMGIISLVGMFVIQGLPIIFGIIGWVMGSADLRKMKANQMDPEGEGMTRAGWICSIIGTLLNGAVILLVCGLCGLWSTTAFYGPTVRTTRSYIVPAASRPMNPNKGVNPPRDFKDWPQDK